MLDVLFKPSSHPLVGIDISTSSVKLIELSKTGNTYQVESFAAEAMPSNAITDKVIMDVDAVGDAVRKAVKRASPRTKYAAVAVGGQVMTKTIQMPAKLSDKDLGEQIELQADQYISQPIEEVAFDYEIVGCLPETTRIWWTCCWSQRAARAWTSSRACSTSPA